jgi:DNA primase
MRTRAARIAGEAKDPDEFLRGGGSWDEVLRAARPGWEVLIRDALGGLNTHSPADREVGIRRIREVLAQIRDPAEKDTYAEVAGGLFEIEARLLLAVPTAPARRPAAAPPATPEAAADGLPPSSPGKKLSKRLGYLLQVLVVRPEALERVLGILDPSDLVEDDRAAYLRVVEALQRGGLDGLGSDLGGFSAEERDLVRRAWAAPPPAVGDEAVDDLVRHLRRDALYRRHREIKRHLTEAEQRGDRTSVSVLEVQLKELSERIPGLETRVG